MDLEGFWSLLVVLAHMTLLTSWLEGWRLVETFVLDFSTKLETRKHPKMACGDLQVLRAVKPRCSRFQSCLKVIPWRSWMTQSPWKYKWPYDYTVYTFTIAMLPGVTLWQLPRFVSWISFQNHFLHTRNLQDNHLPFMKSATLYPHQPSCRRLAAFGMQPAPKANCNLEEAVQPMGEDSPWTHGW